MKERPIRFTTEMVRAILEGRSTQTRRVINPQPPESATEVFYWSRPKGKPPEGYAESGCWCWYPGGLKFVAKCPYGEVGDRMWVKEIWRVGAWDEDEGVIAVDYKADDYCRREWLEVPDPEYFNKLWIESSDDAARAGLITDAEGRYRWKPGEAPTRWRSARFMPRFVARILLEITNIRVERLQDIGSEDIHAEGIDRWDDYKGGKHISVYQSRGRFRALWDSINARRGYGWDTNPYVWVVEFRRVNEG